MVEVISISTVYRLHQKLYKYETHIEPDTIGLPVASWVWGALLHAAEESKLKAKSKSDIGCAMLTLTRLRGVPTWEGFAHKALSSLSLEDVLTAFGAIEHAIQGVTTWGANTRNRASIVTRGLLTRYLVSTGFPKAEGLTTFFRTVLPIDKTKRRQLISDQVVGTNGAKEWPIGAIPHETIEELQRKTIQALESVLERIQSVCSRSLEQLEHAKHKHEALASQVIPKGLIASIQMHQRLGWAPKGLPSVPTKTLAAAYVQIVRNHYEKLGTGKLPEFDSRRVQAFLTNHYGLSRNRLGLTFFPLGVGMDVLLSCLLVLQIHTGWNVNTVLELTLDGVSGRTPPFQIKSYKSRVGKQSSIVPVERADIDVVRALDFLAVRLQELKRLGRVQPNEVRLWLADFASDPTPFVGWGSALTTFQQTHDLPRFSLEQVRTQVLCLRGETGGLEEMRRMAHHKSINTTGGYAFQLLLYRKNEAVNLEFQKRLEREVVFAMDGERHSKTKLLWPVGDGTSCADPKAPPHDDYLMNGVCSAEHCHQGDGCRNRTLTIDRPRIEEALRTSAYYEANWARLLGQNRDAFEVKHLPSMVFNRALVRFVESGRYAHVVRELRTVLSREVS